jgi:hypothetical protein
MIQTWVIRTRRIQKHFKLIGLFEEAHSHLDYNRVYRWWKSKIPARPAFEQQGIVSYTKFFLMELEPRTSGWREQPCTLLDLTALNTFGLVVAPRISLERLQSNQRPLYHVPVYRRVTRFTLSCALTRKGGCNKGDKLTQRQLSRRKMCLQLGCWSKNFAFNPFK